ncbi:hypothetical protein ACLUTX_19715 [Enterobacterales bacterium AE_CKDN230030158-1A_HGKHYDSX7]
MAWKTEQWMRDVFPGSEMIYEEYRALPRRELAVVAGAVLDSALAELLAKRLAGPSGEIHAFLGVNGDGRAPCGSFGARIQLALLTSIITEGDAALLRAIKNIRNQFAHEVHADFTSASVLPLIERVHDLHFQRLATLLSAEDLAKAHSSRSSIKSALASNPEAGAGLLLGVFAVYQAYFHRLFDRVSPILPFPLRPLDRAEG